MSYNRCNDSCAPDSSSRNSPVFTFRWLRMCILGRQRLGSRNTLGLDAVRGRWSRVGRSVIGFNLLLASLVICGPIWCETPTKEPPDTSMTQMDCNVSILLDGHKSEFKGLLFYSASDRKLFLCIVDVSGNGGATYFQSVGMAFFVNGPGKRSDGVKPVTAHLKTGGRIHNNGSLLLTISLKRQDRAALRKELLFHTDFRNRPTGSGWPLLMVDLERVVRK